MSTFQRVENNEKDTSKKKEKKNGEPVRLTAIEAMKVAASNQREEEEKKLMLAMQIKIILIINLRRIAQT